MTDLLNRLQAADLLIEHYSSETVVENHYDNNREFADAVVVLVGPDFEYPDLSHKTVGALLKKYSGLPEVTLSAAEWEMYESAPQGAVDAVNGLASRFVRKGALAVCLATSTLGEAHDGSEDLVRSIVEIAATKAEDGLIAISERVKKSGCADGEPRARMRKIIEQGISDTLGLSRHQREILRG